MMQRSMIQRSDGFSLIEVLVAIGLFAVISVAFYGVLFAGVDGSNSSRSVVRTSAEARLGFNRMVRDTREAAVLVTAGADSYRIQTDFDRDGSFHPANGEDVTFSFAGGEIRLSTPAQPAGELLVSGVSEVPGRDLFSYFSNLLEYDTDGDGRTTCLELDAAPSPVVGNGNGVCDGSELPYLSGVAYAMEITEDGRSSDFFTQAELRNKR